MQKESTKLLKVWQEALQEEEWLCRRYMVMEEAYGLCLQLRFVYAFASLQASEEFPQNFGLDKQRRFGMKESVSGNA